MSLSELQQALALRKNKQTNKKTHETRDTAFKQLNAEKFKDPRACAAQQAEKGRRTETKHAARYLKNIPGSRFTSRVAPITAYCAINGRRAK